MSRTLEQKRAVFAMKIIDEWKERESTQKEKTVTLIQKAPVQILQNGLGQTLAFLLADNEGKTRNDRKPSGRLYDELQTWLCGSMDGNHPCRVYESLNLLNQLMNGDRHQYQRAQTEAMALLSWLKKFAVANLK